MSPRQPNTGRERTRELRYPECVNRWTGPYGICRLRPNWNLSEDLEDLTINVKLSLVKFPVNSYHPIDILSTFRSRCETLREEGPQRKLPSLLLSDPFNEDPLLETFMDSKKKAE